MDGASQMRPLDCSDSFLIAPVSLLNPPKRYCSKRMRVFMFVNIDQICFLVINSELKNDADMKLLTVKLLNIKKSYHCSTKQKGV